MKMHIISVDVVLFSFIIEVNGMEFWACADAMDDLPYNVSVGQGTDRMDTFVSTQAEVVKAIKKFIAGDKTGWEKW